MYELQDSAGANWLISSTVNSYANFDILPIITHGGGVHLEFWKMSVWNFQNIA